MTTGGWVFMAISWGIIFFLITFCFKRVFSCKDEKMPGNSG